MGYAAYYGQGNYGRSRYGVGDSEEIISLTAYITQTKSFTKYINQTTCFDGYIKQLHAQTVII